MISTQVMKRLRLGLALLAGGLAFTAAVPVAAQTGTSGYSEDAGSALSRHLKTLATAPRSLSALLGAGEAALELGDAQAAATFYARAEEVAPRDGRVKAGLGSAFLAMEQVPAALKFFEDARALGAPEGEYAADRGLAHDLTGNNAQAQRDYELAMRTADTPEVRRRLALSKAISGDRAGALAIIDEQLRRQDRSAWRVRAFILALTGDAEGATAAVRAVMPGQAAAMEPFLARLPMLSPAGRAMAVHFGHFPADIAAMQVVQAPQQYTSAPQAAPRHEPPAAAPTRARATAASSRQRPATTDSGLTYAEERAMLRGSGPVPRRSASEPPPVARAETRLATTRTNPPASAPMQGTGAAPFRPVQGPPSVAGPPVELAANTAQPAPNIVEITPPPSTIAAEAAPAATVQPASAVSGLASIAAAIKALPDEAPAEEAAKPAVKKKVPPKAEAAPAKAPARHWVQIASAPDTSAAAEYRRIKGKSPKLLGATAGWKTANRVLVGPFKDRSEAQALVNALAKADIAAVPWTSPEGQEIVKLAAK